MSIDSTRVIPDVSEMVVALFTDLKHAKDAIYDLSRAGFDASQINVAYPSSTKGHPDVSNAEHTVLWNLRDSFERDMYRSGASQVAGEAGKGNVSQIAPYTEVDLRRALSEVGVAPDRVLLLEREMGAGVLLLVKGRGHSERAEEILERNEGTIRTDSALEVEPKS